MSQTWELLEILWTVAILFIFGNIWVLDHGTKMSRSRHNRVSAVCELTVSGVPSVIYLPKRVLFSRDTSVLLYTSHRSRLSD